MINEKLEHDPQAHKFWITLANDEEAYLRYEEDGQVMNISTTFVPSSARGRKLGEHLVLAARDFARSAGLKLSASCWYALRVLSPEDLNGQGTA